VPATNKPNKRLFKGEHEFFKEGIPYTYRQFVEWTEEFTPPGVNGQTMKGRLGKEPYCLPEHLLSADAYIAMRAELRKKASEGKEAVEKKRTASQLESHTQVFSQCWLSRKLIR